MQCWRKSYSYNHISPSWPPSPLLSLQGRPARLRMSMKLLCVEVIVLDPRLSTQSINPSDLAISPSRSPSSPCLHQSSHCLFAYSNPPHFLVPPPSRCPDRDLAPSARSSGTRLLLELMLYLNQSIPHQRRPSSCESILLGVVGKGEGIRKGEDCKIVRRKEESRLTVPERSFAYFNTSSNSVK